MWVFIGEVGCLTWLDLRKTTLKSQKVDEHLWITAKPTKLKLSMKNEWREREVTKGRKENWNRKHEKKKEIFIFFHINKFTNIIFIFPVTTYYMPNRGQQTAYRDVHKVKVEQSISCFEPIQRKINFVISNKIKLI